MPTGEPPMGDEEPYMGATPGVLGPKLSPEPLGDSGFLSPGPDDLRPEIPEERAELVRRGYLRGESEEDKKPTDDTVSNDMPPLFRDQPVAMSPNAPLSEETEDMFPFF